MTYLVTGATSGIGKAVCQQLVRQGDHVFGVGRNLDRLPEGVSGFWVDLRDESAIQKLFRGLDTDLRLDGLVNAAGLAHDARLTEDVPDSWRRLWEINVHALAVCCQESLPRLAPSGIILNVGSMSGHRVNRSGGFYAATKFAVRALSDSLRNELRNQGSRIRVSCISPGFVDTPILDDYLKRAPERLQKMRQDEALLGVDETAQLIVSILKQPAGVEIADLLVRSTEQST